VAERIFTPFFTTKPEGMGLGLSLCRTVIEQHGGALTHRPAAPQGTTFSFTLPATAAPT
jgi:two-component system sensor histidine kinase DctS